MPIFSKTFDIKSVPMRGKRANDDCPVLKEKLDDYANISLNFGHKIFRFQDGRWTMQDQQHYQQTGGDGSDVGTMKRHIKKLEQINNLNQIKIDVLLDMMSENIAEQNKMRFTPGMAS